MNPSPITSQVRSSIEIALYLLLIFGILLWCYQIISPFLTVILWAAIIAVACLAPYLKLTAALGGRGKLAVVIFALVGLALVVVPVWLFAGSLISSASGLASSLDAGEVSIPPPAERIKEWPVVGKALYENWSSAAANLSGWLSEHATQVRAIVGNLASKVLGIGLTALQFIASVLIAAVMLASHVTLGKMMRRIATRLSGEGGDAMIDLASSTVRSVAVGVLGVAFIQAVAGGAGMVVMGVPAAGVWALIILVLAIAQLPPILVLLPAIIYVFSTNDNTTANVIFAVWSVLVSVSDSFLKPLLLGRGVKAPMLVILLGAIGGMLHYGIIGLFLGAVILALGYNLFVAWLVATPVTEPDGAAEPDGS